MFNTTTNLIKIYNFYPRRKSIKHLDMLIVFPTKGFPSWMGVHEKFIYSLLRRGASAS